MKCYYHTTNTGTERFIFFVRLKKSQLQWNTKHLSARGQEPHEPPQMQQLMRFLASCWSYLCLCSQVESFIIHPWMNQSPPILVTAKRYNLCTTRHVQHAMYNTQRITRYVHSVERELQGSSTTFTNSHVHATWTGLWPQVLIRTVLCRQADYTRSFTITGQSHSNIVPGTKVRSLFAFCGAKLA